MPCMPKGYGEMTPAQRQCVALLQASEILFDAGIRKDAQRLADKVVAIAESMEKREFTMAYRAAAKSIKATRACST